MKGARERSRTPLYVALGVAAVAALGAYLYMARGSRVAYGPDPSLPVVQSEGYVLGSPNAPVEVVEFADFECPACAQFATITEPDVRERLVNTGQVRLRFIDFPLPMHRNTWTASHAAACANDQGKFWELHDLIFQNQDRWSMQATSDPAGVIHPLAQQVGLDMDKYDQCMKTRAHLPKIQAHLRQAEQMGVGSTPTFIINGQVVPGSIGYDRFKQLVDEAMRNKAAGAAGTAPGRAAGAGATTGAHPGHGGPNDRH